jgi:hypothetical protein
MVRKPKHATINKSTNPLWFRYVSVFMNELYFHITLTQQAAIAQSYNNYVTSRMTEESWF